MKNKNDDLPSGTAISPAGEPVIVRGLGLETPVHAIETSQASFNYNALTPRQSAAAAAIMTQGHPPQGPGSPAQDHIRE